MRDRLQNRTIGPAPELPPQVYAERRRQLLERLGDGVAIVPAAPELLKSRDTEIPYRPASDLYYLTGVVEPEAVAVLTPHDAGHEYTLFVRPRAPELEAWSGPRAGVEGAAADSGATAVYMIAELPTRLPELLRPAGSVHYPLGAHPTIDTAAAAAVAYARKARQRTGSGPTALVDLEALTGEMRLLKDEHELERIRTAARISAAGHRAAMEHTRPGLGEWEIQAVLESTFRTLGASAPAFPSIVGAGANATILHYVAQQHRVGEHDLVLIDAGAEWGMYGADITRTFPASGNFSPEQRDLYDIVLAAENAAIAAAQPGAPFAAIHDAAVRVLVRGLLDLGVLPEGDTDGHIESGAYRRYYLHQTSHWLGLDVHDAGPYKRAGEWVALEPGMVLTIEPGIYLSPTVEDVPAHLRGLGVRIEDDIVIREEGNEILTREVPVEPEAIEALMRGE